MKAYFTLSTLLALFFSLTTSSYAFDDFTHTASFDNAATLTASALAATIAHNSYLFQPSAETAIGGNQVINAANNNSGVVGIVQNNAPGSIVQQSINVHIGTLNNGATP